jgi:1-acyl-sn-glycerol-3-phosphate acyltransferase
MKEKQVKELSKPFKKNRCVQVSLGVITLLALLVCITAWFIVLIPLLVLRAIPVRGWQRFFARLNVWCATYWVESNRKLYAILHSGARPVEFIGQILPNRSYLVLCNHQSWADVLLLFNTLNCKVPFLRFFLKKELIWVPIVGVMCWAMDFPFMRRYGAAKLAKTPQLIASDLKAVQQACEKYKRDPVALVNFVEGTRYTAVKAKQTKTPYQHLLKPKYGGLATALNAMGEQFAGVIDVTMVYQPGTRQIAWSWLCGQQTQAQIHVRVLPVPSELLAIQREDTQAKQYLKHWLDQIWVEKDKRIHDTLTHMNH